MSVESRISFSRIGVVLATIGSAVGLGNIWRFPYMLGTNGGAAFLLIYIICILLLGLPMIITEFFIGRHTQRNTAGAFKKMAPNTAWSFVGYNGVLVAFLILGFYFVIAGWTFEYLFQSLGGSMADKTAADFEAEFSDFSSGIFRPIMWTFVFVGLSHHIITTGVKKGIERASKFLMPLLFVIMLVLCIRSLMLPSAAEGLSFLFKPDFNKINSSVIFNALGQAFFSLSIGMGCLITYSSYFSKTTNLQRTALEVMVLDTIVALLAGIMIFPAVFHFGVEPTEKVALVFITLPNIFAQLPLGNVWSFSFYLLLGVAALTSTISLHEVSTAYLHEEYGMTRKRAATYVSIGTLILALFSSLSFGLMKDYTCFGLTFFEALDFLTSKIMLPLGGIFICLFVGYRVDKKILKAELTNEGSVAFYFFRTYHFLIKYIAPVSIGIILLNELGVFRMFE